MSRFYVAALTGQSGTGKSLASDYLAGKGVPVIDGDVLARRVVEPGHKCLDELTEAFGKAILNGDGSLDRQKLADLAFATPENKRRLDSITHPYIIEEALDEFDRLHAAGEKFCVVEAAALIESGLYANTNKIILIKADRDVQIDRIVARDDITREQATSRIAAQYEEDVVEKLAHYIIENNGTKEEFYQKLDALQAQLVEWFC